MPTPEDIAKSNKAWQAITNDDHYKAMSAEDQQRTQDVFKTSVPGGEAVINQFNGPNRSLLNNIGQLAKESVNATVDSVRLADDTITGNIDENTPGIIARGHERASSQFTPPELSDTQKVLARLSEEYNKAYTPTEIASSVGSALWDSAKEVVTNPKGVAMLGAQSAGFSIPSIVGAVAGTATPAGPIGGVVGAFSGGFAAEAGAKLSEIVIEELTNRGVPVTEANIATLLAEPEFKDEAISRANLKAAGTAGTDALMGVGVGKIATLHRASAIKKATMKLGPDAPTELLNAEILKNLKDVPISTVLANKATAFTAEIGSEVVSEGAGQLAADNKLDLGELAGEALGAISMSAVTAPADIYAYGTKSPEIKSALSKAKDVIADVITPKSEEQKAAETVAQGTAAPEFDTKVKEAVEAGDVSKYSDPKNEAYNPSVAVNALKEMAVATGDTDKTKLQEALSIYSDYSDDVATKGQLGAELQEKQKIGPLTEDEAAQLKTIHKTLENAKATLTEMDATIASMHQTKLTPEELIDKLDEVSQGTDPEAITAAVKNILSHNGGSDVVAFGSQLEAIKSNPHTTPETLSFVKQVQEFQSIKDRLETVSGKDTDVVHNDITQGVPGFKGINYYHQAISTALNKGDEKTAQAELDSLNNFAGRQATKAQTLRNITDAKAAGTQVSPEDQANLDMLNASEFKKGRPYAVTNPTAPKWLRALDTMEAEAELLAKSSGAMNALFAMHGKKPAKASTVNAPVAPPKTTPVTKAVSPGAVQSVFKDESIDDPTGDKAKGVLSLVQNNKATPEAIQAIRIEISNLLNVNYNHAARIHEKILNAPESKPVPPPKTENKPNESTTIEKPVGTMEQKPAPVIPKVESRKIDTKPVVTQKEETVSDKVVEPKEKQQPQQENPNEKDQEGQRQGRQGLLKWVSKDTNAITDSNGNTSVKVNSLSELIALSKEYQELMFERFGKPVGTVDHSKWFEDIFNDLVKAGILFKPLTINFTENLPKTGVVEKPLGITNSASNTISLATGYTRENIYPLKVVLHEYVHAITLGNLSKYPVLLSKTKAVMEHALKQNPALGETYGFTNEKEFLAEVISSPALQVELDKLKPFGKQSIVEAIREIFNALLKRIDAKDISLLTESLSIAIDIAKGITPVEDNTQSFERTDDIDPNIPEHSDSDFTGEDFQEDFNGTPNQLEHDETREEPPIDNLNEELSTEDIEDTSIFDTIAENPILPTPLETLIADPKTVTTAQQMLTPEEGVDPKNIDPKSYSTINLLKALFAAKSTFKLNLLQIVPNLFSTLKAVVKANSLGELSRVFNGKYKLDGNVVNLLGSMSDFHSDFSKTFKEETFRPIANQAFRFKDPFQYIDTSIDNTVGVLSAVAYKWLATRSTETLVNDRESIGRMLGFKKEIDLAPDAIQLLKDVGSPQNFIVEDIGKEAYRLLNIAPKKNAPANFEQMMQLSLGQMIVSNLQQMKLVEVTSIYTGLTVNENVNPGDIEVSVDNRSKLFGIAALKANTLNKFTNIPKHDLSEPGVFFVNDKYGHKGKPVINFYKVASNPIPNKKTGEPQAVDKVVEFKKLFSRSKHTWERMFSGQVSERDYSWEPVKITKDFLAKIKKTTNHATAEQTANLIAGINKPWHGATHSMDIFGVFSKEGQMAIAGAGDPSVEHISERDNVADSNRSIERELEAIEEWSNDADTQPLKRKAPFYINAFIAKNLRTHQAGRLNPQGSKLLRYLFAMKGWESTFKIGTKEGKHEKNFFLTLGLSFGLEVAKIGTPKEVIAEVRAKLKTPAIRAGIDVLRQFQKDGVYTPEFEATVIAAVKAGKENAATYKGLVEYARYENALEAADGKSTSFTTDLVAEMDGIANGPTLAQIQMIKTINARVISTLRNAGIALDPNADEVGTHLKSNSQMDTYQAVGMHWNTALRTYKNGLIDYLPKSKDGDTKRELSRFTAAERLMGNLTTEDGYVSSFMRKLTKDPTMQTVYGSGDSAIVKGLTVNLIKDIYKKIKDIAATNDRQALIDLVADVNILADLPIDTPNKHKLFVGADLLGSDGKLIPEKVLNILIPPMTEAAIFKNIAEGHGAALTEAIDAIYGDIKDMRKSANMGFSIVTALYNVAFSQLVEARKKELNLPVYNETYETNKKTGVKTDITTYADLSIEEYAKITEALKDMFPSIKTPFKGGRLDVTADDNSRIYGKNFVTQSYGKKGGNNVATKTSYLREQWLKKNPGVSTIVIGTQMQDGSISNRMQGEDIPILHVHDGFFGPITSIEAMNETINKHFYEVAQYNLLDEMYRSVHFSYSSFRNMYNEMDPVTQELWKQAIEAEFKRMGITEVKITDKDNVTKIITAYEGKAFTAIDQVLKDMKFNATIAKTNKKIILDAVQLVNQYNWSGPGYKTGNDLTSDASLQNLINIADVTMAAQADQAAADIVAGKAEYDKHIEGYIKDYLARAKEQNKPPTTAAGMAHKSSPAAAGMSDNPADYDPVQEVNNLNIVDIYNLIKNQGDAKVSSAHDSHLQRILFDIVSKVMNPADLYLATQANTDTMGKVYPGKSRDTVFVSSRVSGVLAQGIKMSTGEVYAHEMLHPVIHYGFEMNPYIQRQVDALYRLAKEKLNHTHFMSDPKSTDPVEIADAKARFDYVFVNAPVREVSSTDSATGLTNTKKYSNRLDEFMAFGLTNEHMIKALTGIPLSQGKVAIFSQSTWAGIKKDSIQATLVNIFNKIMSIINNNFRSIKREANVAAQLEALARELKAVESKHKGIIATSFDLFDAGRSKLAKYVDSKIAAFFKAYPQKNLVKNLRTLRTTMTQANNPVGQMLRDMRRLIDGQRYGLVQQLVSEIRGKTDRLESIHMLMETKKILVDKPREAEVDHTIKTLKALWSRELTDKESEAITKSLLKADLGTLYNHFSIDEIASMLESESNLKAAIDEIERQIWAKPEFFKQRHYYQKQARSLGHTMVTGRSLEEVTLPNTRVIASLHNTYMQGTLKDADIDHAEMLIDWLASMYALTFVRSSHRATLHKLIKEDPNAVAGVMSFSNRIKTEAKDILFANDPLQTRKGYIKEIFNSRVNVEYGSLSDEAAFAERGYARSKVAIPRDPDDPEKADVYIYTAKTGAVNSLLSGLLSFTGNRAKGTNSRHIQEQLGVSGTRGAQYNNRLIAAKQMALNDQFKHKMAPFDRNAPTKNYMIPKVNDQGQIVEYRYEMSEAMKEDILEQHKDYADILGAMAGQIVDKVGTKEINTRGISALKDVYDAEYKERFPLYVEISPYSKNPELRSMYHKLPASAKQDIKRIWGDNKMFVAKDIVNLAFGSTKYSITEAFGKTPAERNVLETLIVNTAQALFKDKKIQRMKDIEDAIQDTTKITKNNVIVRTLTVTAGNSLSNTNYCKAMGVPTTFMAKQNQDSIMGMLHYEADATALGRAKVQLKILKGMKPTAALNQQTLDSRIQVLETKVNELDDALARNPVTPLVDAGVLQSIVDEIETSNVQSPYPGQLDTAVSKLTSKLNKTVLKSGKVIFLAEDTAGYKMLNNAVKATDFVSRYTMYKWYTDPSRGKERFKYDEAIAAGHKTEKAIADFIHKKAVAQVIHEFVNFNLPTHKMIEYGNAMGFIWYSKYFLRILKPIANAIKEHPFEAITAFLMAGAFGLPSIWNSVPFLSKNPLNLIENPFSAFIDSMDESIIVQLLEDPAQPFIEAAMAAK